MDVLANHAHVFPEEVRADGTVDRLLALLDACEIDEAVCFAPFPHETETLNIEPNRWLAERIAGRSRLRGFGTLDLRREDVADQVRRIADLGFPGMKLHPNSQRFDILHPAAMTAYAAAQELGLFIAFHSGVHQHRIADYNVLKFDEVAWRFPELRFSLEHVGGWAFFHEAVAVITNNIPFPAPPDRLPTVYGGLTSVFTPDYNRFWYMSPDRMRELVRQAGAERLIFGLDFPYNRESATRAALKAIDELKLSRSERDLILGGALRRAL